MPSTTSSSRLIDALPPISRPSAFPMRVLVLSPARSGTTSTEFALKRLGFTVYQGMKHGFIHAKRGENTYPQWAEALDAKYPLTLPNNGNKRYGIVKPYTTADFEKILGHYDAVVGWPASNFVDEMLTAYPDAKVILMDRPTTPWATSIHRALTPWLTYLSWKILLPLENGLVMDTITCGQRCLNIWTDANPWDREALERHYEEHNAYVKKVVPKERLLVYQAEQGWEPLCEFLGMSVPDQAYPKEAVGGKMEKQGMFFWMMALKTVTRKVVRAGVLLGAVYLGLRVWRGVRA